MPHFRHRQRRPHAADEKWPLQPVNATRLCVRQLLLLGIALLAARPHMHTASLTQRAVLPAIRQFLVSNIRTASLPAPFGSPGCWHEPQQSCCQTEQEAIVRAGALHAADSRLAPPGRVSGVSSEVRTRRSRSRAAGLGSARPHDCCCGADRSSDIRLGSHGVRHFAGAPVVDDSTLGHPHDGLDGAPLSTAASSLLYRPAASMQGVAEPAEACAGCHPAPTCVPRRSAGRASGSSRRRRHREVAAHLPAVARARRGRAERRSAGVGGDGWNLVGRLAHAARLGHRVAGTSSPSSDRGPSAADVLCPLWLLRQWSWTKS